MGQRECRRVPLDFAWPVGEVWGGYITPEGLREQPCADCDGSGYSPHAQTLKDRWYGRVPFDPSETGSTPLTPQTPEVRALAERNIDSAPDFYGSGEAAIIREAERLCRLLNSEWCHHLHQRDVDALVAADRLWDFTRTWSAVEGWQPIDPAPVVTAERVNAWSIKGMSHDSLNCSVVIGAECERLGHPEICDRCHGYGSTEKYEGQRDEANTWEWTEPPAGQGWQLWETTSDGSPISPVFATAEELAEWCQDGASMFGSMKATKKEWLEGFLGGTTDMDSTMVFRYAQEEE